MSPALRKLGPVETAHGMLLFNADSGRLKWKYHTDAPVLGGVTATAGGLLMTGDNEGNFLVLDSASGKLLKRISTQGSISGGIATYVVAGRQYIALTSGNISRTGFGAVGRPRSWCSPRIRPAGR